MRARMSGREFGFIVAASLLGGCLAELDDEATTVSAVTMGQDLVVTMVTDPPATATVGQTFAVSDTTQNIGTFDADASWTKYYLSQNGTGGLYMLGVRSVPLLAPSASDTGGASATIPLGVAQGDYFLLACADRGSGTAGSVSDVEETNENNNCLAAINKVTIGGPDLVESNVSASPSVIDNRTGTLTVTDTVTNSGTASANSSITRWYLSPDAVRNSNDAYIRNCTNGGPVPGRNVPSLAPGASNTGSGNTTPLCVRDATGLHPPAPGTYYVLACADESQVVGEVDEKNQCAASSNTILVTQCGNAIVESGEACDDGNTVGGDGCSATCALESLTADLVATSVSEPPATGTVGGSFSVTDTIQNVSSNAAPDSTTYYYLSTDQVQNSNDRPLTGSRSVPALAAGASDMGSTTVTVPATIPAGNWYLLACADGPGAVSEAVETNNCISSTMTIAISGADLVMSALSNPPATAIVGSSFSVTDTTSNIGASGTSSFYNKYYLSLNGTTAAYYLATRSVGALAAGASETATISATILSGTPSGTYYLFACADRGPGTSGGTSEIPEINENNNCRASTTTIVVSGADLVVSAVSNPPASATIGSSFVIDDTTANIGAAASPSFYNKYYLSLNGISAVRYLATRSVGALGPGATESGTVTATISTNTPAGTYFVLACADRGPGDGGGISQVPEVNENNNCRASTGTVVVSN